MTMEACDRGRLRQYLFINHYRVEGKGKEKELELPSGWFL